MNNPLLHFTGLPDGYYGAKFSWRSPGSEGAMTFQVIEARVDECGDWRLICKDGNDRRFEARAPSHSEAMFAAMGVATGFWTTD